MKQKRKVPKIKSEKAVVETTPIRPRYLRIVPRLPDAQGAQGTMGTQVICPDGTAIPGVTSITLIARVNDVWRAQIECIVAPPEISADAIIEYRPSLSWWRLLLLRMSGVHAVELTDMASLERQFRSTRMTSIEATKAADVRPPSETPDA